MMKWFSGAATIAALACGLTSVASASILLPGGSGAPDVFSSAGFGGPLADTGIQSLNSGTFTANFESLVFTDSANPFCAGCLDFVYIVARTGGNDPIERITAGDFSGFQTDVGVLGGTSGTPPLTVDRSSLGGIIGFNYPALSALRNLDFTQVLVVATDTKYFTRGLMSAIDQQSANGVAFAPSNVPEPMTMSLMGVGLLGLGLLRKRIG